MTQRHLTAALLSLIVTFVTAAEGLDRTETKLVAAARDGFARTMSELEASVNIPSASENLAGVKRVAELYAPLFEEIGFETRWVELPESTGRAGHFVAEQEGTKGPRILFIGHLDTVLEGEEFRRDGNTAYGSGIADMKAGNIVIWAALKALSDAGALKGRRIVVIFTGDEESPGDPLEVVRHELIDLAKRSDVALGYEEAGDGSAVVGRRGIAVWRLEVDAETGHSSGIFSERLGSGAIFEASRILTAFHETLMEANLTFNPSVVVGGTDVEFVADDNRGTALGKSNVVPRKVFVKGDLRFLTSEQYGSARAKMAEIVSRNLPGTKASIDFEEGYPSMAPTEGNRRLLAHYDAVSRDLGYGPVVEYDPGKRGAGDISFVAAYVDGLDGLGAFGTRSHAPGESIDVEKLQMQIERTALLMHRLTSGR
jgi:glutamate carboxypeptidase